MKKSRLLSLLCLSIPTAGLVNADITQAELEFIVYEADQPHPNRENLKRLWNQASVDQREELCSFITNSPVLDFLLNSQPAQQPPAQQPPAQQGQNKTIRYYLDIPNSNFAYNPRLLKDFKDLYTSLYSKLSGQDDYAAGQKFYEIGKIQARDDFDPNRIDNGPPAQGREYPQNVPSAQQIKQQQIASDTKFAQEMQRKYDQKNQQLNQQLNQGQNQKIQQQNQGQNQPAAGLSNGFDQNEIDRAIKESLSARYNPGNFVEDNVTTEEIWPRITEKDSNAGQPVTARSRRQLALKKGGAAAKQLKTRFSREIWKQDQIDQLWNSVASNFREIIGTTSAADPFTDFKNIIDKTLQNKYSTYSTKKDTNFKNIEGFFYGPYDGSAFDESYDSFKIKDKAELLTVMKNAQNYALCINKKSVTDEISKLVNFVKNTSKVNLLVGDVNKKTSNKISDLSKKFGLSGEEMKSVINSAQPISLGQIKDVVKKWIPESVNDTAPVNVVINLQKHLGKKSEELSNLLFTVFQKKSPVDYAMLTDSKKTEITTLLDLRIGKLIKSAENTDVAAKIKSDPLKKSEPSPEKRRAERLGPEIEKLWV